LVIIVDLYQEVSGIKFVHYHFAYTDFIVFVFGHILI